MKCHVCRENDAELTTTWERVRFWLFNRTNHVFFPQDFDDLRSDRYTQGYSDGYVKGVEDQRKQEALNHARYGL